MKWRLPLPASQRETALRGQLEAAQGELSKKEAKAKDLRMKLATAQQDAAEAKLTLGSTMRARRQDAAVLRRVVEKAAETMQQLGLFPVDRNQHPDDDQINDHAQFFSHLMGQLVGLKELMESTLERSRMQKELADKGKEELAVAK